MKKKLKQNLTKLFCNYKELEKKRSNNRNKIALI
jgi:hypothetical protein